MNFPFYFWINSHSSNKADHKSEDLKKSIDLKMSENLVLHPGVSAEAKVK